MIDVYIWFIGSLVGLILSLIGAVFHYGDLVIVYGRGFPVREILARGLMRTEGLRTLYFVVNLLAGLIYVLSPTDIQLVRMLLVWGPYIFIAATTFNLIDRFKVDRKQSNPKNISQ